MNEAAYDLLVVGGGHAGAQAAITLAQAKFEGTVAILSDEPDPPYERPPLSKDYLAGAKPFERILIRPRTFWAERGIALVHARVAAVDPAAHRVTCADGRTVRYGKLLWAAGGRPRRLPCVGHDLAGVHAVRTRADVDALAAELPSVPRVVVVGGGYIGLEAAAVLRGLGKQVVVIEAQPRLLARVAGAALGDFFAAEHRAHGVEVRTGTTVAAIEGRDGRACGVRLADGTLLACDLVIVGIGIVPEVAPLVAAGATAAAGGVLVDAQCRTSLPDVWAAGDCAAHASAYAGGATTRIESVQNANDQASVAARGMIGTPAAYDAVPWFWSHQYDLKLQTVGLSAGHDDAVVRGDPASRGFSVVYLRQTRVIALDCVDRTRDYVQGRALVTAGARIAHARLADADEPLKAMMADAPAETSA